MTGIEEIAVATGTGLIQDQISSTIKGSLKQEVLEDDHFRTEHHFTLAELSQFGESDLLKIVVVALKDIERPLDTLVSNADKDSHTPPYDFYNCVLSGFATDEYHVQYKGFSHLQLLVPSTNFQLSFQVPAFSGSAIAFTVANVGWYNIPFPDGTIIRCAPGYSGTILLRYTHVKEGKDL